MNERCNVCGKFIKSFKEWVCEECGCNHHPECSGESSEGTGEYPSEDAYSICKKCCKAFDKKKQGE